MDWRQHPATRACAAMSYQYDIFVSYRQTSASKDWVQKHFYPKLVEYLSESLPTDPKVFLDTESIEEGAMWQAKISGALQTSKCLIAVLNAQYFTSKYCSAEWRSFVDREQMLQREGGLIVPIRFFDGAHFDPSVAARQLIDMSSFAISADAFKQSLEYIPFTQHVRDLAEHLAKPGGVILAPPPFAAWPVHEPKEAQGPKTMPFPGMK
jgi:hypothetical protein